MGKRNMWLFRYGYGGPCGCCLIQGLPDVVVTIGFPFQSHLP